MTTFFQLRTTKLTNNSMMRLHFLLCWQWSLLDATNEGLIVISGLTRYTDQKRLTWKEDISCSKSVSLVCIH